MTRANEFVSNRSDFQFLPLAMQAQNRPSEASYPEKGSDVLYPFTKGALAIAVEGSLAHDSR